jgi:hypothetical protein
MNTSVSTAYRPLRDPEGSTVETTVTIQHPCKQGQPPKGYRNWAHLQTRLTRKAQNRSCTSNIATINIARPCFTATKAGTHATHYTTTMHHLKKHYMELPNLLHLKSTLALLRSRKLRSKRSRMNRTDVHSKCTYTSHVACRHLFNSITSPIPPTSNTEDECKPYTVPSTFMNTGSV